MSLINFDQIERKTEESFALSFRLIAIGFAVMCVEIGTGAFIALVF